MLNTAFLTFLRSAANNIFTFENYPGEVGGQGASDDRATRALEYRTGGRRLKALGTAFLVWKRFNLRVIPPKIVFVRGCRREAPPGGCFPCCFPRQSVRIDCNMGVGIVVIYRSY